MGITNWQDRNTMEAFSSHINGLQDFASKVEDVLGLKTLVVTDIVLTEVSLSVNDSRKMYEAVGRRNWLASPAPIIKKNGLTITEGFTIDYAGGAIIFTSTLEPTDVITASFTYTINESIEIDKKVDKITGKGLSTEDYTTTEKNKLLNIQSGAEVNQPAFSYVNVGGVVLSADADKDTLFLSAGNGVIFNPNPSSDSIVMNVANATTSAKGIVQLSSAVDNASTLLASNSLAVKTVNDKIGDLSSLSTSDKLNLVNAINEVNEHKYFWIEEKILQAGQNTITLTNPIVAGTELIVRDREYGLDWFSPENYTINGQNLTFPQMNETLTFRITNLG